MREIKKILSFILCIALLIMAIPISANAEDIYVDRKADVVFVIDATGSMGGCISSVKSNITDFINLISKEDVDIRVKFVIYRDITESETTQSSGWYSATDTSSSYLTGVDATGGGDTEETLLDGLGMMLGSGFRSDAVKYCIAFTDAGAKLDNGYGYSSEDDMVSAINGAGITMSMVTESSLFDSYSKYVSSDGGVIADINSDYSILLRELAKNIVTELDGLNDLLMNPRNCCEGEEPIVSVTSNSGMSFDALGDFYVLFDNVNVDIISKDDSHFEFKVPASKPMGKYEVKIVKDGVQSLIGHFTIESAAEYGSMSPDSTTQGIAVTVTVPVSHMTYASDFTVKMGGKKVSVGTKEASYFTFKVTSSMEVKSYDVVVTNGGAEKYIGDFTIGAMVPSFSSMNPNLVKEGTTQKVKVSFSNFEAAKDFNVLFNGTTASGLTRYGTYFIFKVPSTTAVGVYPVSVVNNGMTYYLGTIEVIGATPISPTFSDMSVKTTEEGTEAKVKVTFSNLEAASDFNVLFNGASATGMTRYGTYFTFKVPSTTAVGVYPVSVVNNGKTYDIGEFEVTVSSKVVPEPVFSDMSVKTTEEGTEAKVKVTFSNLEAASDFNVLFNGASATGMTRYGTYFIFKVPSTTAVGVYSVSVVNNGKTYDLGMFEVTAKVIPEPIFSDMSVKTAEKGTAATVKVTFSNLESIADINVLFNGVTASDIKRYATYFTFKIPNTTEVGVYPVSVAYNGKTYDLGTFEVTAKVVPEPVFSAPSPSSISVGSTKYIKVNFSNFTAASDFNVKIGDTNVLSLTRYGTYFRFKVPKTVTAGTYEIKIINNGMTYTAGTLTIS